jgi:hypothetical protein
MSTNLDFLAADGIMGKAKNASFKIKTRLIRLNISHHKSVFSYNSRDHKALENKQH